MTPFAFNSPHASTGFLVWQMSNVWQRQIRVALEPFGLTHVQFALLAGLLWLKDHNDEDVSQAQLAQFVKADVMMTSKVVRSLAEKGLLARSAHAGDTRAKSLQLTQKGRELLLQAIPTVEACDARFFQVLGAQAAQFNAQLLAIIGGDPT
jgi:MarR family transcriptional regulator, organic hydroperoxide resistance regulator